MWGLPDEPQVAAIVDAGVEVGLPALDVPGEGEDAGVLTLAGHVERGQAHLDAGVDDRGDLRLVGQAPHGRGALERGPGLARQQPRRDARRRDEQDQAAGQGAVVSAGAGLVPEAAPFVCGLIQSGSAVPKVKYTGPWSTFLTVPNFGLSEMSAFWRALR